MAQLTPCDGGLHERSGAQLERELERPTGAGTALRSTTALSTGRETGMVDVEGEEVAVDVDELIDEGRLGDRLERSVDALLHLDDEARDEEVGFVVDVGKQGAGGDVGGLADLTGGGLLEALLSEQASRSFEDAGPLLLLLSLASADGLHF